MKMVTATSAGDHSGVLGLEVIEVRRLPQAGGG
jgi:hypothetical protein